MIQIKICGLSTAETLHAAITAGADFIGLNAFPPSPRFVAVEQAAALSALVPASVGRVGVFVDPDDALLAAMAPYLDIVQVHGVTPARSAAIGQRWKLPVWVAISVGNASDIAASIGYKGAAERLLFDARTPKAAILPGGMGVRFDWRLLAGRVPPMRWGLAGGLDAGNVAEAIAVSGTNLVDAASGVEEQAGVKSVVMIKAFIAAAKAAA